MPLVIRTLSLAVYVLICCPALTLRDALRAVASAVVYRRLLALCPRLALDTTGEAAVEQARLAACEMRKICGKSGISATKPPTGDAVVVLLHDPNEPPPPPPTAGGRGRLRVRAGAGPGARETAYRVAEALRQADERRAA